MWENGSCQLKEKQVIEKRERLRARFATVTTSVHMKHAKEHKYKPFRKIIPGYPNFYIQSGCMPPALA